MATLTELTALQSDLKTRLEKAVKSKKGTKTLREQLAEVERQVEQFTAESVPAKRGRPRLYEDGFYTLRDALKRGSTRGRPSREQTVASLQYLGVEVDESVSTHSLEVQLVGETAIAFYNAKRS